MQTQQRRGPRNRRPRSLSISRWAKSTSAPVELQATTEGLTYPNTVNTHSIAVLYLGPNSQPITATGLVQVNSNGSSTTNTAPTSGDEFAGIFNLVLANGASVTGSVDMVASLPTGAQASFY